MNPFANGTDPLEQRGLWDLDDGTGQIVDGRQVTLAGFIVTGLNSITIDPTTGVYCAVLKVAAVSGRVLATIDPATGVATQIGNLGDNFSSLAFRSGDGQLFGMTGDGATVSETLFLIDKATATTTLAATLGNGADGEVIAYNPNDNHFYHWSGDGTVVYERVLAEPPIPPREYRSFLPEPAARCTEPYGMHAAMHFSRMTSATGCASGQRTAA